MQVLEPMRWHSFLHRRAGSILRRIDSPFVWNGKSANELSVAYIPEEEIPMLKKLALASTAIALLMSTASADYYIVQDKGTKKCMVVETRQT